MKVVSKNEWVEARKRFLAKEKEFTHMRDRLSAERRALPWMRVEKEYAFDGPNGRETFELSVPDFQVTIADALGAALRAGLGIGPLPMSAALPALASGALVRVLPDYRLQKLTVYTLYASRQYLDAKIRTFVDFLRECVPEMLAADEAALNACCASRQS